MFENTESHEDSNLFKPRFDIMLSKKHLRPTKIGLQYPSFINMVSGAHQTEEPQQFYGGIVADSMGLGKTLTAIALVATDLDCEMIDGVDVDMDLDEKNYVSATLVVLPPSRMFHFFLPFIFVSDTC